RGQGHRGQGHESTCAGDRGRARHRGSGVVWREGESGPPEMAAPQGGGGRSLPWGCSIVYLRDASCRGRALVSSPLFLWLGEGVVSLFIPRRGVGRQQIVESTGRHDLLLDLLGDLGVVLEILP